MRARMFLLIVVALMVAGCAPAPSGTIASPEETQPAARKKIVAAINSNPASLSSHIMLTLAGTVEIETLIRGGLAAADSQGTQQLQLGEVSPSIENGLWKLLPGGRMETTWRLKPGVVWQDGAPLTSEDLVFTLTVVRDRDVPFFGHQGFSAIESVEAVDARTLTIRWKEPFINADQLFSLGGPRLALPMPKHLLEQPYREDKANFAQLPYWTDEFIGAGPYRVREFAQGSYIVLEAFDQFILGRPKIDEIEIRFIPDTNAFMANILARAVDVGLGRALSFEQGQAVREQWREGRVDLAFNSAIIIYPQFLNPSPAVMSDVRFRRALYHALDREEMVSTLMGGLSTVAHFRINSADPDYPALERAMVKYPYDPRRAAELIGSIGYKKGPDGKFRDSDNRAVNIEIRTGEQDYQTKPMFAATDYWQRLGIEVDPVVMPEQRARDLEYRATFPAFELVQQSTGLDSLMNLESTRAAVPENRFQVSGKNYGRYASAELDALVKRYFVTIPTTERLDIAGQAIRQVTDQVVWMALYYAPQAMAIANRLQNVVGQKSSDGTVSWNAHEWDVR